MKSPDQGNPATIDLLEAIEQLNDPAVRAKIAAADRFLHATIFRGLNVRHPSFDSNAISHFSATDFQIVVERCSLHAVKIIGVEVFTSRGRLLEVSFQDARPDSWCLSLIEKYRTHPHVSFCASYSVPDDLL